MSMPALSKAVFQSYMKPLVLKNKINKLSLRFSDYFLLGRLAINIKGSTTEDVVNELMYAKLSDVDLKSYNTL